MSEEQRDLLDALQSAILTERYDDQQRLDYVQGGIGQAAADEAHQCQVRIDTGEMLERIVRRVQLQLGA